MTTADVQSLLNLAAGTPLVAVVGALIVFRKFTKLFKRLLVVAVVLVAVLAVNNYHLLANR